MGRDALVVGINRYNRLAPLESPAKDAEAIARLLEEYGGFRVRRLPEAQKDGAIRVSQKFPVSLAELEEELRKLFLPEGNYIPDTALLYFSGHGLRKPWGRLQEGFLATSDINPDIPNYGLSLRRLRWLLQESPVKQQIVWLDCCHSGELFNFQENLKEADPGNLGEERDRSFIAASRGDEAAYAQLGSEHSLLTEALIEALDPNRQPDGCVSNYTLVNFIEKALKAAPQRPIFTNSGRQIILTGRRVELDNPILEGICPYKGLSYFDFNTEDPKYFYGRTALTDELLEKVREGNFLAVVGASGSGKSSAVRAGLLYQLKLGERISGSNQWSIYIFRPHEHPLESLAEIFLEPGLSTVDRADQLRKARDLIDSGAVGLGQLITAIEASRVVLVVDQFEECFTLCRDSVERQQFFECLMGAVERPDNKLCLVLTMRADFFAKCLDYAGLAKKIEENLVAVKLLKSNELKQAISEPAKQVGLEVEEELVNQMIADVEGSPGSLPLLQYALTELWKQRAVNWLTLSAYNRLGGVRGTLQKRAEEVYETLSSEEKEVAKRIFLELTQLGEGTEDTRRQVLKRDLVTPQQSEGLVEKVLQTLADAKLVVTSELLEKAPGGGRVAVVDVAHESLIRHWPRLGKWLKENREALSKKRTIQDAAQEWLDRGKPHELAYLLQGSKLAEAEEFHQRYGDSIPLSSLAREFILLSQIERDRLRKQEQVRKRRWMGVAIAFPVTIAISALVFALQQQRSQKTLEAVFLDTDTTEILSALPGVLQQARDHRNRVDTLGNADDIEGAIAYYRQHKSDIEFAFAYYREILRVTGELQKQIRQNPSEFSKSLKNGESLQAVSQKIDGVLKEAEESLAAMILKYRIPELKKYLFMKPMPKVGELVRNTNKTDFEDQYTEGALQTTYAILMRDSGAGADLNNDGYIRDEQEANQLPCAVLQEIERLWRESTKQRCGWYGPQDAYRNPNCRELGIDANTLTISIFDFDSVDSVEKRFNKCKIPSPKPSALGG
jgi:energy-coupling factor transporter ATP-binding protein EcfA2